MHLLLNALAAPSAFAEDFKQPKLLLPLTITFGVLTLTLVLQAPLALSLSAKQSNLFADAGLQEYTMYYIFGIGSQIIGLLLKWGFATFFLGTVFQFAVPAKQNTIDENGREIPVVGYSSLLCLIVYSGVILSFETLIKAFAVVLKNYRHSIVSLQDLDVSIGLSLFTEKIQIGAFLYAFLGEINPISLWGYGVLAFWIVRIYRIRPALVYGAVGALWFLCTVLIAAMQQFSANMTGAAR